MRQARLQNSPTAKSVIHGPGGRPRGEPGEAEPGSPSKNALLLIHAPTNRTRLANLVRSDPCIEIMPARHWIQVRPLAIVVLGDGKIVHLVIRRKSMFQSSDERGRRTGLSRDVGSDEDKRKTISCHNHTRLHFARDPRPWPRPFCPIRLTTLVLATTAEADAIGTCTTTIGPASIESRYEVTGYELPVGMPGHPRVGRAWGSAIGRAS